MQLGKVIITHASTRKETTPSDYNQVIPRNSTDGVWNCIILFWLLLLREYIKMSSNPVKKQHHFDITANWS